MTIVTITRPARQKIIQEHHDKDGDIVLDDASSSFDVSSVNAGTVHNANLVTPGELVTDETTWMRYDSLQYNFYE